MLVLNEIQPKYIFYWKDYIWKKLTAFNIAFLKSLNFIVRNSWYPKYYRIWTHLWRLRFIQSVHQHYVWRDIAAGFVHVVVQFFLYWRKIDQEEKRSVNAHHKLILIRARNDYNCLVGNSVTEPEIELFKVQWRMPHVKRNQ